MKTVADTYRSTYRARYVDEHGGYTVYDSYGSATFQTPAEADAYAARQGLRVREKLQEYTKGKKARK